MTSSFLIHNITNTTAVWNQSQGDDENFQDIPDIDLDHVFSQISSVAYGAIRLWTVRLRALLIISFLRRAETPVDWFQEANLNMVKFCMSWLFHDNVKFMVHIWYCLFCADAIWLADSSASVARNKIENLSAFVLPWLFQLCQRGRLSAWGMHRLDLASFSCVFSRGRSGLHNLRCFCQFAGTYTFLSSFASTAVRMTLQCDGARHKYNIQQLV